MKRITALLFSLLCLLPVLTGCFAVDGPDPVPSQSEDTTTKQPEGSGEAPAESDTGYTALTPRKISGYSLVQFAVDGHNTMLRFSVPNDWTLGADGRSAYRILRDGDRVGYLGCSVIADHDERCVLHETEDMYNMQMSICVLRSEEKDFDGYSVGVSIDYRDDAGKQQLELEVAYTELSAFAKNKIVSTAQLVSEAQSLEAGTLKLSRPSILILGNSFINSSKLGTTLQAMFDAGGRQVDVTAVSHGYATVSTYVEAADYLRYIENGQYGIVFICGFYGSGDTDKLDCFVDACKASGTHLVIFPAHNENQLAVSGATLRYAKDAYFLNWKGEITDLIKAKAVTESDMCVNDQHKHSTPLAGFVGAHMIYRTLFGSMPSAISTDNITTAEATRKLGDYVRTGEVPSDNKIPVYQIAS